MRKTTQKALDRSDAIIQFLYLYQLEHKYPPNIRETGNSAKIPSTSVTNYYLDVLEKRGLVSRARHISRGTFLTEDGIHRARVLLGYSSAQHSPNCCSQCGAPVDSRGVYAQKTVKVHNSSKPRLLLPLGG